MDSFTDILLPRTGFLVGVGRVLDIGADFSCYNYALTPRQADFLALYADWRTIGSDLRSAMKDSELWEDEHQPWLFRPEEVALAR